MTSPNVTHAPYAGRTDGDGLRWSAAIPLTLVTNDGGGADVGWSSAITGGGLLAGYCSTHEACRRSPGL
ncbi:hypothetical protein [Acetobacter sicerae]|uniref:hypothetical protein n=1 Tax=Acetobacter sicerae TaxID=85325 RepID=UPI00156AF7BD|nr:hypothetical protein [Acetobacter sicerae]NHN93107.1 hypothetical protein [Acetobacter sicerae]